MQEPKPYDYIIAGMGCAGLSLAMQLKRSTISFQKILLIDKELKNKNDRTWCFWTKETDNWFDAIVFKKWKKFSFNNDFHSEFDLNPYDYCMIKGRDFYAYCLNELKNDARFEILTDAIISIDSRGTQAFLETSRATFTAAYIFNSAFRNLDVKDAHVNYVQHFKGWVVECDKELFKEDCPIFMDFEVEQHQDFRFVYVIPFSKTKALVEYTGFSKEAVSDALYDEALSHYLTNNLKGETYRILETEKGSIPMVESAFINPYGERVINIGTAGGSSKASTGYTFYFIQKHTCEIISQLQKNKSVPTTFSKKKRFILYDKILLDVLNKNQISGKKIFNLLFRKNKIGDLLAFLNEESNLSQDIKIMNSVPKIIFMSSAFKKLLP